MAGTKSRLVAPIDEHLDLGRCLADTNRAVRPVTRATPARAVER